MVGEWPRGAFVAATALVVASLVFLLAPLAVVAAASLSAGAFLVFPPQGLSLRWFVSVWSDPRYLEAAWNSLVLALATVAIAVPLGTAAALALRARRALPARSAFEFLFLSPLVLPTVVLGIGLLILASTLAGGPSRAALVGGHVVIALPFVVRTVGAVLAGIDPATDDAARVMGARAWQRLLLITLPQAKAGIAAGAVLAFIVSFDDAVLVLFLRSPTFETVPLRIYAGLEFSPDPGIAAVSTCLILLAALAVGVSERLLGGRRVIG